MKNKEKAKQEEIDETFKRSLYLIDDLSSQDYAIADILKDYIDSRLELLIEDLKANKFN